MEDCGFSGWDTDSFQDDHLKLLAWLLDNNRLKIKIVVGVKSRYSLLPREIAMFGDRLATDIKFGCVNGFVTSLVLTGEATAEDAAKSGLDIDYILPSICCWDK